MRLFDDLEAVAAFGGDASAWRRLVEALTEAPPLPPEVMHSRGDSLTFVRTWRRWVGELFVGHRRYFEAVHAEQSEVEIDVARCSELVAAGPYDDLSDRQLFRGEGRCVRVPKGGVLVLEIDEATRWRAAAADLVTVSHVTVEGKGFHNK